MDVFGVHGIAQRGQRALSDTWTQALGLGWPEPSARTPPRWTTPVHHPPPRSTSTNVDDSADIVAGGHDLAELWPQVRDIVVDNGRDAHGARHYLAQPQVGAAVAGLLRRG